MRLFEVVEPEFKRKKYRGRFREPERETPEEEGVAGFYSQIKHDKREQDKIIKRSKTPRKADLDPFWKYLKYIKEEQLMDNPFFPNFFIVTNIVDSEGRRMNKVKMEKLHSLMTLTPDQLVNMFDNYFGVIPDIVKEDYEAIQQRNLTRFRGEPPVKQMLILFVGYIKALVQGRTDASHPILNQAVLHLRDMKNQFQAMWDIKISNLMIRNPNNPELVFTDVFA